MPAYKCKIVLKNGETVERVMQSNSSAALKSEVAESGGFLLNFEKIFTPASSFKLLNWHLIKSKDFIPLIRNC